MSGAAVPVSCAASSVPSSVSIPLPPPLPSAPPFSASVVAPVSPVQVFPLVSVGVSLPSFPPLPQSPPVFPSGANAVPVGFAASAVPVPPSLPAASAVPVPPLPSFAQLSTVPGSIPPAPVPFPAAPGLASASAPPYDDPQDFPDVPLDGDTPGVLSTADSARADLRRMYSFVTQLFPQSAGVPPPTPPPRALFEEFFARASLPPSPIYLNWFERVRTVMVDTDTRLASFLASGRAHLQFLLGRSPQFAVHGDFALPGASELNPSFLALLDRPLRPHLHVGLSLKEAAALEASSRFHLEALSHSLWLLTSLLAYLRVSGFQPDDQPLFSTIVSSLSKCLAHQASLSASAATFVGLKRREFFLSHLPAYYSDMNKRSMMSSPLLCSQFLFSEQDVARLVAETQTSSSLRSQQALVDVASRASGSRSRRASPRRSPGRSTPSRGKRASSQSPSRSKRVRFNSPAPASALKPRSGFRK